MAAKITQNALTVVCPIKPDRVDLLTKHLEAIDSHHTPNPLAKISTIHFARLVIIPNNAGNGKLLVFDNTYDGPLDDFISDFVITCGMELDEIWGHCEDYPMGTGAKRDVAGFKSYFAKYSLDYVTFYVLYGTKSVREIKERIRLRERLQKILDLEAIQNLIPYL